jgi:YhcG PDDEXK nuclease domain
VALLLRDLQTLASPDTLNATFYLDLLFYHVRLHCYFVIELKTGNFKPEWAGKLNFYLSAVDGLFRSGPDAPTVGLLLCETHSTAVVEYALQNIAKPIGVSTYRVTRELPTPMREELPSAEDLQEVVTKLRSEMDLLRQERQYE